MVDGTGILRIVDTSNDTKLGSDNDISNDKVVDLKGARFKNLFGVLRVSNDAYVYGVGRESSWAMGQHDVGAGGTDPSALEKTLLVVKITGVNGSTPTVNNTSTDIDSVTPDGSNALTDGQVITFSNSDQSNLDVKNSSELQVSAGKKIYRYNLTADPKLGTARTAITLSDENNDNGIRNFSIVESSAFSCLVQCCGRRFKCEFEKEEESVPDIFRK